MTCRDGAAWCVFWELDPVSGERAAEAGDPALEKEAWISATLLEWGSCGKIAYVDGVAAGFVLYAPPLYVPRSVAFPTSPVSSDAVLLMTAHIVQEFTGGGLGRMLVQGVAKDLTRRGVRAIEAFGDLKWEKPGGCVLPADYLLSVGFKTVRPHLRFPACGWSSRRPCRGVRTSRWHWSACWGRCPRSGHCGPSERHARPRPGPARTALALAHRSRPAHWFRPGPPVPAHRSRPPVPARKPHRSRRSRVRDPENARAPGHRHAAQARGLFGW